ncbi:phosphatase PAP2 family protein [Brevundimonas sp. 3P9-tot-E]|jgi:acid phosphatase (class A)|uniref:acid phosphatase n=1 Tax=Brevundimonas TaxID=41275 RepID=UPI0019086F44|nr:MULTISPECIES: phosphatase PAP2 family protein [Brevundimonas]MBK1969329.1 phosphatase PAP2 family protein [Brevundimonas diminuta]MBK1975597.1 phosphatase PAP2 family protein [Brevundimonas diminuta]MDA0744506.1 phosphatase PAP2 family protein [Pseudomonadota bacterium]MDM8352954.1 phosphatase PAP2 family protein [Brevundimonas diminuta]
MRHPARAVGVAALLFSLTACAATPIPTFWEGFRDHPHGYLAKEGAPDASAFLPPPPEAGSLRQQADVETYRATRALEGSDRWRRAAADNEIETPSAPRIFDEALGVAFEPQRLPTLTLLLGKMLGDLETIQTPAKQGYFRPRPFVAEPAVTCFPPEPWLARSGSYPSGHAAMGWAWALVLSEMAPDRADAILARGLAYGESRAVCGVHYASDVEAGRLVGAAMVARLKADPAFQRDFASARRELQSLREETIAR